MASKSSGLGTGFLGWGIGRRSFTQPFLDTGNEMVNGIVL
jgi:hypothetical protein